MQILKATPRSELVMDGLIDRVKGMIDALATRLELPSDDITPALADFLVFSTRVQCNGDAPFTLATLTDTPEQIAEKFVSYLDADLKAVRALRTALGEMDRPADEATAPTPPEDDEKN